MEFNINEVEYFNSEYVKWILWCFEFFVGLKLVSIYVWSIWNKNKNFKNVILFWIVFFVVVFLVFDSFFIVGFIFFLVMLSIFFLIKLFIELCYCFINILSCFGEMYFDFEFFFVVKCILLLFVLLYIFFKLFFFCVEMMGFKRIFVVKVVYIRVKSVVLYSYVL